MTALRALLLAALASAVVVPACTPEEPADSEDQDLKTKDGLLGMAPEMDLGKTASGAIGGGQIDAWALDLKGGDKVTVVMTVDSGDLAPDFSLFLSGTVKVKSKSFENGTKKLTKTYELESGGRHYIGVAAYKGKGSGDYSLVATCTGGPCKGEPVVKKLDEEQAGECVRMARECSFARLPSFEGAVGPATSRSVFEECLEQAVLEEDGLSCSTACDLADRKAVCDGILEMFPFYADHSKACVAELDSCIEACYDGGSPGLVNGPEDVCLLNGFNSNCDAYARGHKACGGDYADGTVEQCHAFCKATFGAWNDDLDTICVEECGDLPE